MPDLGVPFIVLIYRGTSPGESSPAGKRAVEIMAQKLAKMGYVVKAINGNMLPEMMVVDLGVAANRDQERANKARRG